MCSKFIYHSVGVWNTGPIWFLTDTLLGPQGMILQLKISHNAILHLQFICAILTKLFYLECVVFVGGAYGFTYYQHLILFSFMEFVYYSNRYIPKWHKMFPTSEFWWYLNFVEHCFYRYILPLICICVKYLLCLYKVSFNLYLKCINSQRFETETCQYPRIYVVYDPYSIHHNLINMFTILFLRYLLSDRDATYSRRWLCLVYWSRNLIFIFLFLGIFLGGQNKSYNERLYHLGWPQLIGFSLLLLDPYCFIASVKAFYIILYFDDTLVFIYSKHDGKRACPFVHFTSLPWAVH